MQAEGSIAAAQDIPLGTELKWSHFTWVRPGKGFSPGEENVLIGKKSEQEFKNWTNNTTK